MKLLELKITRKKVINPPFLFIFLYLIIVAVNKKKRYTYYVSHTKRETLFVKISNIYIFLNLPLEQRSMIKKNYQC